MAEKYQSGSREAACCRGENWVCAAVVLFADLLQCFPLPKTHFRLNSNLFLQQQKQLKGTIASITPVVMPFPST